MERLNLVIGLRSTILLGKFFQAFITRSQKMKNGCCYKILVWQSGICNNATISLIKRWHFVSIRRDEFVINTRRHVTHGTETDN